MNRTGKGAGVEPRGIAALESLNFFMADMQAGIGPFLGVFLLAHGWESGLIGTVMTIGGIAGMIMTTPAGALIDETTRKRAYVIIPGIFTVAASAIILYSQSFWVVAASQVATAIAGAAIGPAVTGITLGMVRQAGFNWQNGRPQSGFQSCRQYGRRRLVRFSRMEVRIRRRVPIGGGVRSSLNHFRPDDFEEYHR